MNQCSKFRAAITHHCEYCQKQFSTTGNLNAHRKIHLQNPDFKCSFCGYETYHKKMLDHHIRTHTKERPYKCDHPDCTANFTTKFRLTQHQRIHSKDSESMFKCSICLYKTIKKSALNSHLVTHSEVKEFSCNLCPYQTKHKYYLKNHHEVVHLKLKPFKCDQPNCDFSCSRKRQLNHHQLVHANEKEKEKLLKFKCDQCPYKATIKRNLNRHLLLTHSTLKKFSCDLCPFRSKYTTSLKMHKKLVHSESALSPFKCSKPNCNYSGKRRSALNSHLKRHENHNDFPCSFPLCTFQTNEKGNLKRHEIVHSGEKPHKCTLCPLSFPRKNSLVCHVRIHTGEAPYPCLNCSYRGKTSSSLTRHLKHCKLKNNRANGNEGDK